MCNHMVEDIIPLSEQVVNKKTPFHLMEMLQRCTQLIFCLLTNSLFFFSQGEEKNPEPALGYEVKITGTQITHVTAPLLGKAASLETIAGA